MSALLANGAFQNFPELRLCFVLSKDEPASYLDAPPDPLVFLYCTACSDQWLLGLWSGMSKPVETCQSGALCGRTQTHIQVV